MRTKLNLAKLVPAGIAVLEVQEDDDEVIICGQSVSPGCRCPACGVLSLRVHSRYVRVVKDLPCCGQKIELRLTVRRFACAARHCAAKIFAERFDGDVLQPHARRTARLDYLVYHLGLALGGRPAQRFVERLGFSASNDTLLRTVRRHGRPGHSPPNVIGIDDWAFRRNCRYGTIVCDLERRRTIALLPDREPATTSAWLVKQPQIKTVARDRGGGYGLAISLSLPQADQVADRWHLMENASQAFLDAVRKSMRQVRRAIGNATINPKLLTAAERLQYQGYLRRQETNKTILGLAAEGMSIREIVRRSGHSRKLIRGILRGQSNDDIFRARQSSLEPHLPWLESQWEGGLRNASELWRRLRQAGFSGCRGVVSEWGARRRRAEKAQSGLGHAPAARTIARLLTIQRDGLTKAQSVTVAAVEQRVPDLVRARDIIAKFHTMLRRKQAGDLDDWITTAATSLVASFANGIVKDKLAVQHAITSQWSNGQTEGQITKLKLVKRQMYGRGKLDLLEARVIGAVG